MFLFNGCFSRDYCQTSYRGFDNLFLFGVFGSTWWCFCQERYPNIAAPDPSRLQERSTRLHFPGAEPGSEYLTQCFESTSKAGHAAGVY